MHRSFNTVTNEHFIDNFNIDCIRYFSWRNIVGNIIGSIIAGFLFFRFNAFERMMGLGNSILLLYFLGILLIFFVMLFFSIKAGNSLKHSLHMVVRRGLFSYIILSMILIIAIISSGAVSFTDPFGKLFYMFIAGQMFFAIIAVPLDFLATFSLKD